MSTPDRILGVNVRYYPTEGGVCKSGPVCAHIATGPDDSQCSEPPPTLAVLVSGAIDDYACYVGHGSKEWVAKHGDKVSFAEACCHFPGGQLKREQYRD